MNMQADRQTDRDKAAERRPLNREAGRETES